MSNNNANRVAVLKKAMDERRSKIARNVSRALHEMRIAKVPINFQSVAKQACVSKSWLYKHKSINDQIRQLRAQNGLHKRSISPLAVHQQAAELKQLRQKVTLLEKQISDLNKQLEWAYAEIFKLRNNV